MSSYQVFARKYRPQTFDEVVGQEHITQTLKNAITTNRLAHAYLFVGPRGTGKTSTARILAKALNCIHGPTVTPCGVCDPCKEIAGGNSLDVLEIDGASNNGVEQVRELRENVRFAPTRGKYKLYIIDEVHMLTTAAFNALLKTLEEPPEHVKFIFATTDVQKVLPTILSRCQRFDLRRIPAELIARHLEYIADKEGIGLAADAARTIAKGAEGGLRDAESMLDQLVAFCGEQIEEQDVLSVFGFTASQTVASLCDHLLDGNSPAALGVVQQQAEAGRDLSRLMADLIARLRNLLVAKADPGGIQGEVGPDELADLEAQAGRIAIDRLLDLIEQFAAAENRMKWAPNKKLHFEIAVIKAIQTLSQATLTEVIEALTALKTGGELPALRPIQPAPPRVVPAVTSSPAPAKPAQRTSEPPAPRLNIQKPATATAAPVAPSAPAVSAPARPVSEPERPLSEREEDGRDARGTSRPVSEPKRAPEPMQAEVPPWEERPPKLPPAPSPAPEPDEAPMFPSVPQSVAETPALSPRSAREESEPTAEEMRAATSEAPDAGDLWPRLLGEIQQKKRLLFTWARAGTLMGIENGVCTIGFPQSEVFALSSLDKPTPRKFIEETLLSLTGQTLSVRLEVRPELVAVAASEKAPEPPPDPMLEFKNDPIIRKALDLFKAEIQTN